MNGFQTTIEIQQSVNLPNLFYVEKDRVFPHAVPEAVASLRKNPTLMSRYRSYIENKMNKKSEIFRLMNQIGKRKQPKRADHKADGSTEQCGDDDHHHEETGKDRIADVGKRSLGLLVVGDGLAYLGLGVHDERAVLGDWLGDGFAL